MGKVQIKQYGEYGSFCPLKLAWLINRMDKRHFDGTYSYTCVYVFLNKLNPNPNLKSNTF